MYDLVLLSNTLQEFVLYRSQFVAPFTGLLNETIKAIFKMFKNLAKHNYEELLRYLISRPHAKECSLGIKLTLGANITRFTIIQFGIFVQIVPKPLYFEENNQLEYLDLTGAPFPSDLSVSEVLRS